MKEQRGEKKVKSKEKKKKGITDQNSRSQLFYRWKDFFYPKSFTKVYHDSKEK